MDRFWSKVRKLRDTDSCWIWLAGKDRYGYGQFKLDGKVKRAHQVSWKLHKGEWSPYLCHTCDNRACVNPDHLCTGDHVQNNTDQRNRGKGWSNKYSDYTVRRVRRMYFVGFSSGEISELLQMPRKTVLSFVDGTIRKHAGGPIRDKSKRYYGNRFKRGIR